MAGAISGVISSFLATPPDFIKTRILSQDKWSRQKRTTTPSLVGTAAVAGTSALVLQEYSAPFISAPTNGTSTVLFQEYSDQDFYNEESTNQFVVARRIIESEGASVLFSGVTERCIGAIPRFGTTLAMHDALEQMASHAGWLAHSMS